jgi:hypothetical protein
MEPLGAGGLDQVIWFRKESSRVRTTVTKLILGLANDCVPENTTGKLADKLLQAAVAF